jgi:hypothetical protein
MTTKSMAPQSEEQIKSIKREIRTFSSSDKDEEKLLSLTIFRNTIIDMMKPRNIKMSVSAIGKE